MQEKTKNIFMNASMNYFNTENYLMLGNCTISIRKKGVKELLHGSCKDRILDLGCGDGSLSLQFIPDGSRVTLVDSSKFMISKCKENIPPEFADGVNYNVCEIEKYTAEKQFDVVLCIGVLAHVKKITEVVAKVSECTKRGGYCIFQITDHSTFGGKYIWLYSTFRELLIRRYGYRMNKINRNSLIEIALIHGLIFSEEYWYSEKTRLLGSLRSDALLMFRKK